MPNSETQMTLDDAVKEVLGLLTGLDLDYRPEYDRYQTITRQLNRALRATALEKEWSYYATTHSLGGLGEGTLTASLPSNVRPRVTNDDAVRFLDSKGNAVYWAYFLPRDAIHKYASRGGLWVAYVRQELQFSRGIPSGLASLDCVVPVMREPIMFRLPKPNDPEEDPTPDVPDAIRNQLVDFSYPDEIVIRAAYFYAQTDPVMQPRVQTLEAQYKDLMYQLIERDDRATDSPFQNEFTVPVQNSLEGGSVAHRHPHADERR